MEDSNLEMATAAELLNHTACIKPQAYTPHLDYQFTMYPRPQEQRGLLARSIEYLFDRIEGQAEQKEAGRSPKP